MCDIMGVCRSSIYYKPVEKQVDSNLENLVITTFKESRRNYGAKRIKKALEKQDIRVSKMRISGIMKKYNLKSKYCQKSYKPCSSKTNHEKCKNVLNRNFESDKQFKIIVSDLTYVRVQNKWAYICVLVDLFNREIVAKSISFSKDTSLVVDCFKQIKKNLSDVEIFHTDRGSEFKNFKIDNILNDFNIVRSLSRKGNPYDNAVCENIYKIIKTEFVDNRVFSSIEQLELEFNDYCNWYNKSRLNGALGYVSPEEYKNNYRQCV